MREKSLYTNFILVIIFAVITFTGCKQGDKEEIKELRHADAVKLRVVPNADFIATKIQEISIAPPGRIMPDIKCPDSHTLEYYDAQITTPITLCRHEASKASPEKTFFPKGAAVTTFKITDPSIFVNIKDLELWQPPLVCSSTNGPWFAVISVDQNCVGSCKPMNTLVVVGVPNSVAFVWEGGFEPHPAGFEFVGTPAKSGGGVVGTCNTAPPWPGTGGTGGTGGGIP